MKTKGLFLTCLLGFCPACFSPTASDDSFGSGADGGGGFDTDADDADPVVETSTSDAAESDSGDEFPGESTTGVDPDRDTDGDPATDDPETTGFNPTEADGGSTGVACDALGTDDDCLFCGDTCATDATCYPQGCLAAAELGFPVSFGDIGGINGFLYGFPVELEADGYLTHFGFVAAGDGAGIQMALYSDLDGAPHARVAESTPLPSYAEGTYQLDVTHIELEAGTYWLMATLGYPRRIAADLNGGQVNFPVSGIEHEFGQPLPEVVADPNAFVNFRPNFFVGVLQ